MDYQKEVNILIRDTLLGQDSRIKFCATTESMQPWITPGDILEVRSAAFKDVISGDIIAYEANGDLWVHRLMFKIIEKDGAMLITKADMGFEADLPSSSASLLGRVVSIQKQDRVINLSRFPWNMLNLFSGLFHLLTYIIISRLRILKHSFLKNPLNA